MKVILKGKKFSELCRQTYVKPCITPYREKATKKPIVWLVKDRGVYVMNAFKDCNRNGYPRHVCYIRTYGLSGLCQREQLLWGGDDFCMAIELPEKFRTAKEFVLYLTVDNPDRLTVQAHWVAQPVKIQR